MNSAGFPGLQGQLYQPASTVGAPALQLTEVPDSSALTLRSLLMPCFGSVAVGNHPRSHPSVASAAASAAASGAAMQPVLLAYNKTNSLVLWKVQKC